MIRHHQQAVGIVRGQHGVGVKPGRTRPAVLSQKAPALGALPSCPSVSPRGSPARHPVERLRRSGCKLHDPPAATGSPSHERRPRRPSARPVLVRRPPPHALGEHQGVIVYQPDLRIGGMLARAASRPLRSLRRQWPGRDDAIVGFNACTGGEPAAISSRALGRRTDPAVRASDAPVGFGTVGPEPIDTGSSPTTSEWRGWKPAGRASPRPAAATAPFAPYSCMDIGTAVEQRPRPCLQNLGAGPSSTASSKLDAPPESRNSTGGRPGRRHCR